MPVKHIDPREIVKQPASDEIIKLSKMMKDSGSNPYRYVRKAFLKLVEGDFGSAVDWLQHAADFEGVFFKPGTDENELFRHEIMMMRYTILFLCEKFGTLPREAE